MQNKLIGTVRRKLAVADHVENTLGPRSGRSSLGAKYRFGSVLGATVAFNDDALDEAEFQDKVLGELTSSSKAVIKLREEFALHQRVANDQQANINKAFRLIAKHEEATRNVKREFYGNPVRRIQDDEEMCARFNLAIRLACSKNGDLVSRGLTERFKDITGQKLADVIQQKALGEDAGTGATLIDEKLSNEIYNTLDLFGVWNTFAVSKVSSQTTKFPVKTARTTANFILTEAGTISDGSITGTSVSNVMEVIAALINVSVQLLEDAEFDLTDYVLEDFAQAYAERLDHACLNADGTADATHGGMTGVFVGGTAATADAGAGADDTVEELEFEDFTRCLLTVDPVVLSRPARWWMHPRILVRALSIKDSNGRPIFLTALEAPTPQAIGSILGYPVTAAFKAPSTNSANQKVAAFGDPRGLSVGLRRDFTFEASDHARWNTLERSFRGYGRAGVKIRRALSFAVLTLGA